MKYIVIRPHNHKDYVGLTRCTGWVGDAPKDALWLIGVKNQKDETDWWWMNSIQAIFELTRFYRQEMGFVGDKLNHVAIPLMTPLTPIPVCATF